MIFLNLLRLLRTSFISSVDSASQGQSRPLISQRPQLLLLYIYPPPTVIYSPASVLLSPRRSRAPQAFAPPSPEFTVAGEELPRVSSFLASVLVCLFLSCSSVVPSSVLLCPQTFQSSTVLLETYSYASFICFPQPIPHER